MRKKEYDEESLRDLTKGRRNWRRGLVDKHKERLIDRGLTDTNFSSMTQEEIEEFWNRVGV